MEEQELKHEITTIDSQVSSIVVSNQETYKDAGNVTLTLDGLIKKVKAYWKDPKEKAHQAHKAITEKENEMLAPLKNMRNQVQKKISVYLTEQDKKKREAQAKLDEDRRKKEEAERKKLEARANRAEESGKTDKAEALREQAEDVYVPPAVVESEVEKTTRTEAGVISQKKELEVVIENPLEVIKAIAKGEAPVTTVEIKIAKLKQYIKLAGLTEFPGCRIEEKINAQFRGK